MIEYIVTEGIESTWHYHISVSNRPSRSLCGKPTMLTNLPMESWGVVTEHIGEKYCAECKRLMDSIDELTGE